MHPPLDAAKLYDIKKALEYYQHEVHPEDLKPDDFTWLLDFVGALLKYVEYQKGVIFDQTDSLRELGVSMNTLKKEVGTFMRKRKASSEIQGGEARSKRGLAEEVTGEDSENEGGRSKRVKGEFDTDGGSQKRSRSEDSEDEGKKSKRMRRSGSKSDAGRPKRSHGEETEDEGGKSKRRRRA
ncbi:hypothetical protein BU23DRAFT_632006 [Bimuria novae-zelandiae CBS 107.79]|uniref:Uncharacterized protein n=1 Tax=Bimuria novae-zelandiae CBS 107.79 TaxID=1447943 RepID=A0A6A5UKL9_9PLEO|nr:hypothetical protein BU23DRAFT_632006 [Bimuria novae-zelandiae CBS 107.79]